MRRSALHGTIINLGPKLKITTLLWWHVALHVINLINPSRSCCIFHSTHLQRKMSSQKDCWQNNRKTINVYECRSFSKNKSNFRFGSEEAVIQQNMLCWEATNGYLKLKTKWKNEKNNSQKEKKRSKSPKLLENGSTSSLAKIIYCNAIHTIFK